MKALQSVLARRLNIWRGNRKKMNKMITKNEFTKEVLESMTLSLVQFTVEWSGACQIIAPMYEELADSYKGQAKFFTVDIEKEGGMENEYGVTDLPTILLFKSGIVIDHIKGLVPKNFVISKIENALSRETN
jgi:thioredoxin 1